MAGMGDMPMRPRPGPPMQHRGPPPMPRHRPEPIDREKVSPRPHSLCSCFHCPQRMAWPLGRSCAYSCKK
jgi:hypothetical protein